MLPRVLNLRPLGPINPLRRRSPGNCFSSSFETFSFTGANAAARRRPRCGHLSASPRKKREWSFATIIPDSQHGRIIDRPQGSHYSCIRLQYDTIPKQRAVTPQRCKTKSYPGTVASGQRVVGKQASPWRDTATITICRAKAE